MYSCKNVCDKIGFINIFIILNPMTTSKIKNSEKGGLFTGVFLIFLSFALSAIPFVFSLDMMQWGYGILCINSFIFIIGFITFLMYLFRYNRLRSILNGEEVITHWYYSKDEFNKKAKVELNNNKNDNKFKLGAVWFFFILFTVIFTFIGFASDEAESMGIFVGIMLVIAIIITAFALTMPGVMYRSSLKASPEAIIATNGMYYMGKLHTWNRPLFLMDAVEIDEEKKELVFAIKYFTKIGWYKYETYSVNIPIPAGEMAKAKEVVKILSNS
jgi:hypothetical protein